jgi:hypothetical protein
MLRQMGVQKVALVGGSVGGLTFLDALWPRREPRVTVTGTTNQPESDAIRDDGAVRTG